MGFSHPGVLDVAIDGDRCAECGHHDIAMVGASRLAKTVALLHSWSIAEARSNSAFNEIVASPSPPLVLRPRNEQASHKAINATALPLAGAAWTYTPTVCESSHHRLFLYAF